MEEITLFTFDGSSVVLKLSTIKKAYAVEEILNVRSKVYSDIPYSISLNDEREIDSVSVYVNGELAEARYKAGIIEFFGESKYPFAGIIGFVQISLHIIYGDSDEEWKHTEYATVLIKPTETNKTIDSMLKYVYENQEDVLYRETAVTSIGKSFDKSYDDFWSQIVLLEEIANVYESSYGYFMANCRTKLESDYALDRVEKMQEVDSRTLQYIVQHPEYMHSSVNGIKYGGSFYLPTKTMMTKKRITNDIYENQVVISFLEYLLNEISGLDEKIRLYLDLLRIKPEADNGYIVSSYLLYDNAKETLVEFLDKTSDLEKQYQKIVTSFSQIFKVKRISMVRRPEPTAIFMNLPQYNRIYTCILRWFGKSGYDLLKERVMLSFINAPSIYEAYVLIKIINQIKDYGYSFDSAKCVNYPKRPSWRYTNRQYNNTYQFSNESSKITLYYEPIVYDEDRSNINDISIYRNNSISLRGENDEERQGHYYIPDYILKYESDGKERYIVCDAKFSKKNRVHRFLMPELIYKYITSLSPINENSEIVGMYVFYGLTDEYSDSSTFYDKMIRSAKTVKPYIEMIPLSETVSYSKQRENSMEVLRTLSE